MGRVGVGGAADAIAAPDLPDPAGLIDPIGVTDVIAQYEALVEELPGDLLLWQRLERLYERSGAAAGVMRALEAQAGISEDPGQAAAIYRKMAALWDKALGRADKAAECLEWAIAAGGPEEELFCELVRLYSTAGRWHAAVDACRRHAESALPAMRPAILAEAAEILARELRDPQGAIDLYREAERLASHPEAILSRLTALLQETENAADAAEVLAERARRAQKPERRADYYYRAGVLALEKLEDLSAAAEWLELAVRDFPLHTNALMRLADAYTAQGEPARAAMLLREAAGQVSTRNHRVLLSIKAAEHAERAADGGTALELYQQALIEEPSHRLAGLRLVELFWMAGRMEELIPIAQRLCEIAREPEELARVWARLGHALFVLGRSEEAEDALVRSLALSPSLTAQRDLGFVLHRLGKWREALSTLLSVLDAPGSGNHAGAQSAALSPADRVEAEFVVACCYLKLRNTKAAERYLARVLEAEPGHKGALCAVIEAELERDPARVIEYKRRLLACSAAEHKAGLLADIGRIYRKELGDRERALAAYEEALVLAPMERSVLHECLELHVEGQVWEAALKVLLRLAEREEVPHVRARYRFTAAAICLENLAQAREAEAHLREALVDDPSLVRAAEMLEDILGGARDWEGLKTHYCEQLMRLGSIPGDDHRAECVRLWDALSRLCAEELGDAEGAQAALQVALHLEPSAERQARLAGYYVEAGADRIDQAIAAYHRLIELDARHAGAYRALGALYRETGQHGRARACIASLDVLAEHGVAQLDLGDTEPMSVLHAAPGHATKAPGELGSLTAEHWNRLRDPGEAGMVGRVFELIAAVLRAAQAGSRETLGLRQMHEVRPHETRAFAQAFFHVARAYGLPSPKLYARPSQSWMLASAMLVERAELLPVMVIGDSPLLDAMPKDALLFGFGRFLAQLAPERQMRLLAPQPGELGRLARAAISLATLGARAPEARDLSRTASILYEALKAHLPPTLFDRFTELASELRSHGASVDELCDEWVAATDRTAMRAALALAPDLRVCAQVLVSEHPRCTPERRSELIAELARANLCEAVLAVRDALMSHSARL